MNPPAFVLYLVQRFRRRKWAPVTPPLPLAEAQRQAGELKSRPRVSAFHVRVVKVDGEETTDERTGAPVQAVAKGGRQ